MIERLSITFLGTGTSQGIPVIGDQHPVCRSEDPKDQRLRTSALIECNQYYIVIDCGPDFRQQLLRNPIPQLDGVFFTHEHADHTHGIDDLRPFYFRQGRLKVYACDRTFRSLRTRFDYVFENDGKKHPGAPEIETFVVDPERPFDFEGVEVVPVVANHHRIDVLGFRIGPLAYMTDVKYMEESQISKLIGVDVLVLSALRRKPHPAHLTLDEAVELSGRIGARRTYLTHLSHMMGFHEETQAELPDRVMLAYDNLRLDIV